MKATEELFNLKNDPLELTNLVPLEAEVEKLETLREIYDAQLAHWKKELVKGKGYEKYVTLFDRHIAVSEKKGKGKVK